MLLHRPKRFMYYSAGTGSCPDVENSFVVTINDTPLADAPADAEDCDSYTLPALTNGNYFTGTGGTGTALNAGDAITSTQTLYVFSPGTGSCPDVENSFVVTINVLPSVPAITGDTELCMGDTITNLATTATGTIVWSSSNTAIATVNATTGVVMPVAVGSTNITYTVTDGNSCSSTSAIHLVTVNTCSLTIVKSNTITDPDGSGDVSVGDVVTYTFTVENTGSATLTGVTVVDDLLGAAVLSDVAGDGVGVLAVGATETATLTYTILASDLGTTITNIVTADSDQTGPDTDTNSIPVATPSMNITKTNVYADNDSSGDVSVGDVVTYTYTVENTGSATLTGVTVVDDLLGAAVLSDVAGDGVGVLAVGATETATLTYTILASDLGTTITNIVTADSDQTGPDTDTNAIPVASPSMNITKTQQVEIIQNKCK